MTKRLFEQLTRSMGDMAVAMLGAIAVHPRLGLSSIGRSERLDLRVFEAGQPVRFGFSNEDESFIRKQLSFVLQAAPRLAELWSKLVATLGAPHIEISLEEEDPDLLAYFTELLSGGQVSAASIYVRAGAPRLTRPLKLPLDLVSLPTWRKRFEAIRDDLPRRGERVRWHALSESKPGHFLIVPTNVTFVPGARGHQARELPSSAVALAFVAEGTKPENAMSFGLQLRYNVETDAVVVVRARGQNRDNFVFALLVELGQGRSLDEAVLLAWRDQLEHAPFLLTSRPFLEQARLPLPDEQRNFAELLTLSEALIERSGLAAVPLNSDLARTLGLNRAEVSAPELGVAIRGFLVERGREGLFGVGATYAKLRWAVRAAENAMRAPPSVEKSQSPGESLARKVPPRHLQATIISSEDGVETPVFGALIADHVYQVDVHIGPVSPQSRYVWKPFPEALLPRSPGEHEVTVVFADITGGERPPSPPQVALIRLGAKGASTHCTFELTAPPITREPDTGRRFTGRIAVLYRNRILQTALITAPVVASLEERDRVRGGVMQDRELVASYAMEVLDERTPFDVALILNHDAEGTSRIMVASDEGAHWVSLDHAALSRHVQEVRVALNELTQSEVRPASLDDERLRELLIGLANPGAFIRELVIDRMSAPAAIRDAKRIQVLNAREGTYLPVELFYDLPAPLPDAKLCPEARQALQQGQCNHKCHADENLAAQYVCPLGFWGFSRIIERQAAPQATPRGDVALRPAPTTEAGDIPLLRRGLLGTSHRVDGYNAGTSTIVQGTLHTLWPGKTESIRGWTAWESAVQERDPSLLVLLVHTEHDGKLRTETIEIAQDRLGLMHLTKRHIRRMSNQGGVLVLLLGCSTALPSVAFQSFVGRFLYLGAAVVVSSIADMLGRHAGPTTVALLSGLHQMVNGGPVDVGHAFLRLRRELLAGGDPLTLCLAVYGDVDWRLVASMGAQERASNAA